MGTKAFQVVLVVKNPSTNARDVRDMGSIPRSGRFSWRRTWLSTPVFLPGKSLGQWRLVGYSPWSYKRIGQLLATKQKQQFS